MPSSEEEVRRVLGLSCQLLDDGRDEWVSLFSDDAEYTPWYDGTENVASTLPLRPTELLTARQGQTGNLKHLLFNTTVSIEGAEAKASSDFMVIGGEGRSLQVLAAGRVQDVLQRTGTAWQIHRRTFETKATTAPLAR